MIENYPIEKFLCHRRGMKLIDKLLSYTEDSVDVETNITEDSIFLEADGVPAWIGIEYAAQAVATLSGVRAVLNNEDIKLGLLLSGRRYNCKQSYFSLGQKLVIHAQEDFNDGKMGAYRCTIMNENKEEIASVSINAYVPDRLEDIGLMTS